MTPWHSIRRTGDTAHVCISGEIAAFAFPPDDLLSQLEGATRAEAFINSTGGASNVALLVHDALAKIETAVTIQHAASAAAIIAMAGKVRRIHADGRIMLHAARHWVSGNANELRGYANELETLNEKAAAILTARTGQPLEVVRQWLNGSDTWFTADEALAAGLVDEILPAVATVPATASQSTPDAPDLPTEAETLALNLLRALGSIRVRDRLAFGRELAVWFQNEVKNL